MGHARRLEPRPWRGYTVLQLFKVEHFANSVSYSHHLTRYAARGQRQVLLAQIGRMVESIKRIIRSSSTRKAFRRRDMRTLLLGPIARTLALALIWLN